MHASPSLFPIFVLIIVLLFENQPYVESWIYKEDLHIGISCTDVYPLPPSPSVTISEGGFPFPTSSSSISHFSPFISNFSPPLLLSAPYPSPFLILPSCHPLPPPTPSSHQRSPSYFSLHCLTPRHLLTFGSLAGSAPRWLQLHFLIFFFLPGKQLKEARLGPPEILIPFQSLPCCQKRLQKRQIRRLKNTFSPFFPLFQFYNHSTNTGKLHDMRRLLLKIQHRESTYSQFSQKLKSQVLLL